MAYERWKASLITGAQLDDEVLFEAEIGAQLIGLGAGVQVHWE